MGNSSADVEWTNSCDMTEVAVVLKLSVLMGREHSPSVCSSTEYVIVT